MLIFLMYTGNCCPIKENQNSIDKLHYTCSAIVLHWGLDKSYPQLSHHSVFLSEDY